MGGVVEGRPLGAWLTELGSDEALGKSEAARVVSGAWGRSSRAVQLHPAPFPPPWPARPSRRRRRLDLALPTGWYSE